MPCVDQDQGFVNSRVSEAWCNLLSEFCIILPFCDILCGMPTKSFMPQKKPVIFSNCFQGALLFAIDRLSLTKESNGTSSATAEKTSRGGPTSEGEQLKEAVQRFLRVVHKKSISWLCWLDSWIFLI